MENSIVDFLRPLPRFVAAPSLIEGHGQRELDGPSSFSNVSYRLVVCPVAGVMVFELVWLILGAVWLGFHYHDCPVGLPKNVMMGE